MIRSLTRPTRSVLLASLTGLLACSTIQVQQDHAPGFDPATLRRYAWIPARAPSTGDPRLDNPLLDQRLRAAIEGALGARGIEAAGSAPPDFWVAFHIGLDRRLDVQTFYTGGWGGYGRGWGGGMSAGRTETRVTEYEQGTLVIDFLEPESGDLLWRGTGTSRIRERNSPEERQQAANEAVNAILEQVRPAP